MSDCNSTRSLLRADSEELLVCRPASPPPHLKEVPAVNPLVNTHIESFKRNPRQSLTPTHVHYTPSSSRILRRTPSDGAIKKSGPSNCLEPLPEKSALENSAGGGFSGLKEDCSGVLRLPNPNLVFPPTPRRRCAPERPKTLDFVVRPRPSPRARCDVFRAEARSRAHRQTLSHDNLLGISWVDSSWVPILNPGNVLDYFSERSNPFYERSCNNEVVKMQRLSLEHLNQMVGVEYILLHAQEPILYIIRKQQRQSPTQVVPLADFYIIAGVVYQAPDLGTVISSRTLSAVHGIQSAFDEAMSYCRYHPSKGYWWQFKDQEEKEKAKPKSKKKEELSSLFQRHRVDTLLMDLRSKFPPTFYQPKPGDKPIPVEVKKEPEAPAETVKQEERESAAKTSAPTPSSKPPPEKRARLQ
uniref:Mediator of RNA polymerase II transcription subunit 6 n=1 Tax=Oryzias sinensis TaxID=183150 RepID=A0A8C7ZB20_9TELE